MVSMFAGGVAMGGGGHRVRGRDVGVGVHLVDVVERIRIWRELLLEHLTTARGR